MFSSKKHKSASTSFSIDFASPNGPSSVCLMLQAHMREGAEQATDHTLQFFPLKDELSMLCDVDEES